MQHTHTHTHTRAHSPSSSWCTAVPLHTPKRTLTRRLPTDRRTVSVVIMLSVLHTDCRACQPHACKQPQSQNVSAYHINNTLAQGQLAQSLLGHPQNKWLAHCCAAAHTSPRGPGSGQPHACMLRQGQHAPHSRGSRASSKLTLPQRLLRSDLCGLVRPRGPSAQQACYNTQGCERVGGAARKATSLRQ
jgi:hypothetical protein